MTVTLLHGDARKLAKAFEPTGPTVVITDPIWPNRSAKLWPGINAQKLLEQTLKPLIGKVSHVVVQVGCTTDPRFLDAVPSHWPFWRTCWLRYDVPTRMGHTLMGGDVAYVFGPQRAPDQRHLAPGEAPVEPSEWTASTLNAKRQEHPCPRALGHVRWLVRWFTRPGETVLDPFVGSGTTMRAAHEHGRDAIGWDNDKKFIRLSHRTLRQVEMFVPPAHAPKRTEQLALEPTGTR